MLDRLCFYSVLFIFTISKVKSIWHPVYGIFLGWENHFSTLGFRLKSVNGGPSIIMRLLTVFGLKTVSDIRFYSLTMCTEDSQNKQDSHQEQTIRIITKKDFSLLQLSSCLFLVGGTKKSNADKPRCFEESAILMTIFCKLIPM